jgi:hypothetical protein
MTEERAAAAWAQLRAWLIDLSKIIVAVGIVGGAAVRSECAAAQSSSTSTKPMS